jgi:hypothetical protein
MAIKNLKRGQITRPAPQTLKTVRYPAPIKGIDARVALTEGSPIHCVYTYNLVPFEFGMALRKGYREFQIDVDDGAGAGVHTMIPFEGVAEDGIQDRLFAATNEGIWDTTVAGAAPVLKLAFADQQDNAGYGVYTHYVDDAGTDLLLYADNINGLFTYTASTETWAQTTGITGPVVANIRWVVSHKQRLWLIEENSTKAWYLGVGSISGAATEFFFGSKFAHGGNLEGLFSWSVDGGAGVDDLLVAVSRSGDVLHYKGADPSSAATWDLVGSYYIGQIPRGPFFGSEHGGQLFLLSTYGLTGMNDLLQGVDTSLTREGGLTQSALSGGVAGLLRQRMTTTIDDYGWSVRIVPSEGALLISSPRIGSGPNIQYTYNMGTSGWGLWRDVPMTVFDTFKGAVVFGTEDNKVMRMDVTSDNVLLTPIVGTINGDPINFSLLTSYQALAADGLYKRVKLIRADFIADGEPEFALKARYDYDISEVLLPTAPPISPNALWDDGAWDVAMWGGAGNTAFNGLQGSWGNGRYIAVAMTGRSRETTRFIGFDVMYDVGGPLV